jgi:hypothetical protein
MPEPGSSTITARYRGDVHDTARAPLYHSGCDKTNQAKDTVDVQCEYARPVVVCDLKQGRRSKRLPALLTRRSIRPNWANTCSTKALGAAGSVRSACKAKAFPPFCRIWSTTRLAADSFLLKCTATREPRCAKSIAVAAPIPVLAPVTRLTWSDIKGKISSRLVRITKAVIGRYRGVPMLWR